MDLIGRAKDVAPRRDEAQSARGQLISTMDAVDCMGLSTGPNTVEGLQRISEANLQHGRFTKDMLERQRRAAEAGRKVMAELRLIEQRLIKVGLIKI